MEDHADALNSEEGAKEEDQPETNGVHLNELRLPGHLVHDVAVDGNLQHQVGVRLEDEEGEHDEDIEEAHGKEGLVAQGEQLRLDARLLGLVRLHWGEVPVDEAHPKEVLTGGEGAAAEGAQPRVVEDPERNI